MSLSTPATPPPAVDATASAAPATAPSLTPDAIATLVREAIRADREESKRAAASAATDPLAAANARVAELEAQHDAAVKKAANEARADSDRRHTRARLLERSGVVNTEDALALDPNLLTADDADAAIAAARKSRPYLFATPAPSAPAATGPAPRTFPSTSAPGNGAAPSAADAQAALWLRKTPAEIAALDARILRTN